MNKLPPLSAYFLAEAEQPPKLTREQFFKYHANSGGKLLTCYIGGKLVHPTFKDWMSLPRNTKIELPTGTLYTVAD